MQGKLSFWPWGVERVSWAEFSARGLGIGFTASGIIPAEGLQYWMPSCQDQRHPNLQRLASAAPRTVSPLPPSFAVPDSRTQEVSSASGRIIAYAASIRSRCCLTHTSATHSRTIYDSLSLRRPEFRADARKEKVELSRCSDIGCRDAMRVSSCLGRVSGSKSVFSRLVLLVLPHPLHYDSIFVFSSRLFFLCAFSLLPQRVF